MKTIAGYSRKDHDSQRRMRKPVVTITLHKSMTKADLFEAAAITLHFLERNKMAHDAPWAQIKICIEGFDDSPKELWEDPGSRTFCKMAIAPLAPALAGHIAAGIGIDHDGMGLFGMAMVALGEELGHPVKVGQNELPAEPILIRIKDLIEAHAPRVNARADELNAGAKPNPHPHLIIRCGEPDELETCLFAAPGMGVVMRQLVKRSKRLVQAMMAGTRGAETHSQARPKPTGSEIAGWVADAAIQFVEQAGTHNPDQVVMVSTAELESSEFACLWITEADLEAMRLPAKEKRELVQMVGRALSRAAEQPGMIPIVYLIQSNRHGVFTGALRIMRPPVGDGQ